MPGSVLAGRLRPHIGAGIPGTVAVALMLVWAVENGGYDGTTWYWGALVLLGTLGSVVALRRGRLALSRPTVIALLAFGGYVAWSYLSITWAESKGDALDGSNRALLYLLLFGLLAVLPWTPRAALFVLLTFVLGVGGIALVLLVRLAGGHHLGTLVIGGRLAAPTGYFNASAALFTMAALTAIVLASRREITPELRALLIVAASAGLQLAVTVQSRGWLFTFPLVVLVGIAVVRDRLRVAAAAVLPVIATLVPLKLLLDVFKGAQGNDLSHAASRAGTLALVLCGAMLVVALLVASVERLRNRPAIGAARRRWLGTVLVAIVLAGAIAGGVAATHGHPIRFISRQWNGFSHEQTSYSSQSHFLDVGSGRYDFWRVALDAFAAHPVGGLGQDNFGDYYLLHRRTGEEPAWTHSLELRLLASTGLIGFALFALFLVSALRAALLARRRGGLCGPLAAAALIPLVVWLIHGSVDWFWEMPALAGPALGFLALSTALGEREAGEARATARVNRLPRAAVTTLAGLAFAVCLVVLSFPYISDQEIAAAGPISVTDPDGALHDLQLAADLNPLSSAAGRSAGTLALRAHEYETAEARFRQSLSNQPLGWLSWLGAGLAESELGHRNAAHHDFVIAERIDKTQPAVSAALADVYTRHPLSPDAALGMLVVVQ